MSSCIMGSFAWHFGRFLKKFSVVLVVLVQHLSGFCLLEVIERYGEDVSVLPVFSGY
jgi:hypothetical protein